MNGPTKTKTNAELEIARQLLRGMGLPPGLGLGQAVERHLRHVPTHTLQEAVESAGYTLLSRPQTDATEWIAAPEGQEFRELPGYFTRREACVMALRDLFHRF